MVVRVGMGVAAAAWLIRWLGCAHLSTSPPCLSTVGELRQSKFVRIPTLMPWEPRVFRDVETMDASPSAPLDVVSSGDGTVRPWFVGTAAFGVSEVPRRGNRAGGGETGVRMVW